MSFIFGTNQTPRQKPKPMGVDNSRSSTNEQAKPLPYLIGKRRFAGTFITDAFDQKNQSVGGGGKFSSNSSTGTNYYASFAVAFCLGPCDAIHDLLLNGEDVFCDNNPKTPSSLKEQNNIATLVFGTAHGLNNGDFIIVVNADQTEFNGEFAVTVLDAFTVQYTIPGTSLLNEKATGQIVVYFKLQPIYRFNNQTSYGASFNCSSLTGNGNIATYISPSMHGLNPGDQVLISGPLGNYTGVKTVLTTPDFYTFTYAASTGRGSRIPFPSIVSGQKVIVTAVPSEFVDITIPKYGVMRLYWGSETQPADDYLPISGINHPPMKGVCYAVFKQFFLGLNQTNIQNVEITLSRTPAAAWLTDSSHANISDEANPIVFLFDYLTHPRTGFGTQLGMGPTDFNTVDLAAAADRIFTDGIGVSALIDSMTDAQTVVQQICETIDAVPTLDPNGLFALKLIRAGGAAAIELTDENLADLPKPKSLDWSNAFNETRITFLNRDSAFTDDCVEWKDFCALNNGSNPQINDLKRDFITRRDVATALVQAAGSAAAIPALTGSVELLFTAALWAKCLPGNTVTFNFTNPIAARSNGTYRVTKRTLAKSSDPMFQIEYAADRSYLYDAVPS